MTEDSDAGFLREALALAGQGMRARRGGPFGAVVVTGGRVVGRGCNEVTSTGDPTAHAEVVAIRDACRRLGTFSLEGGTIYCSCEPCPMCLAAVYWARLDRVVYAGSREDAAVAGFDDARIYAEAALAPEKRAIRHERLLAGEARRLFAAWLELPGRQPY